MLVGILRILFLATFVVAPFRGQTDWRNIQTFGAIPNDGEDDSDAIQAAFDSVGAQGGTVYCPTGTYDIFKPIVVTTAAARFLGDGGPSYNEDVPLSGCMLLARTDGMTLLRFDGRDINHRGPLVEYVNFRDTTPAGYTATLLEIRYSNRWTVRNVSVGHGNIGLKVNAGEKSDASWGYVSQLICRQAKICIDQAFPEGGFLVLGGDLTPLETAIRVRGAQARVVGAKFDCERGSVGVLITGHGGVVTGSLFEQCSVGVRIQDDGVQPWSGEQNRIIGNHFRGWDGGPSKGVEIGPDSVNNQVIGNTYEAITTLVDDKGASTKRYEQGIGANESLTCPPGQAVKSITVKEGIVTRVRCGLP